MKSHFTAEDRVVKFYRTVIFSGVCTVWQWVVAVVSKEFSATIVREELRREV
jgi:hypothetical protein